MERVEKVRGVSVTKSNNYIHHIAIKHNRLFDNDTLVG